MSDENHADHAFVQALLRASARVELRLTRTLSNISGLSFSEYQLLSALESMHEATATRVEIAEAVRLTPSGVTRALKPLEKRGYIETSRDPNDARRSRTTLTDQGAVLLGEARGVVDGVVKGLNLSESYTDEERAILLRALTELGGGR